MRDHQNLLFFTTDGQAFCVKAYEIPHSSRTASGTALPQASTPAGILNWFKTDSLNREVNQVEDVSRQEDFFFSVHQRLKELEDVQCSRTGGFFSYRAGYVESI